MPGETQFQELLFGIQNSANEKLFNDRCAKLFEADESRIWIDVYRPAIAQTVPITPASAYHSSGGGPSPDSATAHRVGDDIECGHRHSPSPIKEASLTQVIISYLGRCAVRCYRESNVEDLRLRIEQISGLGDASTGSSLPKRSIFWYDLHNAPQAGMLTLK
jgi:hypothetical protein